MIAIELGLMAVMSYLVGSVPVARWLSGGVSSSDAEGSRVAALEKVFIDMAKGAGVVWVGHGLCTECAVVAAFGVYLGHNYPVFPGARGGNGLATLLGALVTLDPVLGLIALVSWKLAYFVYKNAAAAAMTSAGATALVSPWLQLTFSPTLLVVLAALIFWRHRRHFSALFQAPGLSLEGRD